LPDTEAAKRAVDEFGKAGITGFNYWFLNMYHFINQWDHIKELRAAAKLPIHVLGAPQDYKNLYLPKSQEVVGRLISFGIRCTWTQEEVRALANSIAGCVERAVAVTA
jgi:8-amino-3,8-dideoxy-alpha-D-manno-octulosonate transaminase